MLPAVLLIAHGSRVTAANRDLHLVADTLRASGEYQHVAASFLELAQPSIPEGGRECAASGASEVLMLPYFLSAGSHVTTDLERFRQELSAEHPHVRFVLCPHLGLHPLMLEIVKARLSEGRAAVGM